MANIVVVGGIIKCSHGGQVRLISGDNRLNVDGNDAILQGQEVGLSFALGSPGVITQCPIMTTTTPSSPSPCTATQAAIAGISVMLTIGGLGVMLNTASGVTVNATSPGTWSISDAGQNKVEVKG